MGCFFVRLVSTNLLKGRFKSVCIYIFFIQFYIKTWFKFIKFNKKICFSMYLLQTYTGIGLFFIAGSGYPPPHLYPSSTSLFCTTTHGLTAYLPWNLRQKVFEGPLQMKNSSPNRIYQIINIFCILHTLIFSTSNNGFTVTLFVIPVLLSFVKLESYSIEIYKIICI